MPVLPKILQHLDIILHLAQNLTICEGCQGVKTSPWKVQTPVKKDQLAQKNQLNRSKSFGMNQQYDRLAKHDQIKNNINQTKQHNIDLPVNLQIIQQCIAMKLALRKMEFNYKTEPDGPFNSDIRGSGSQIFMEKFSMHSYLNKPSRITKIGVASEIHTLKKINSGPARNQVPDEDRLMYNFTIYGLEKKKIRQSIENIDELIPSNPDLPSQSNIEPSQMRDPDMRNVQSHGDLLYSHMPAGLAEQQASIMIFPFGIAQKIVPPNRAHEKMFEIISTSVGDMKPFTLSFERQTHGPIVNNDFLEYLNMERRLFVIGFSMMDFTVVDLGQGSEKTSSMLMLDSEKRHSFPPIKSTLTISSVTSISSEQGSSRLIDISEGGRFRLTIAENTYCIWSYYPLLGFFQSVMKQIFNQVKFQRQAKVKAFQELNGLLREYQEVDSHYQQKRVAQLFNQALDGILADQLEMGLKYKLQVGGSKVGLSTEWSIAKTYFLGDWIYTVLSLFTAETFLELLTLVLLEDRLVFVCPDKYVLTHTLFLFAHVLTKPFLWTLPLVFIVPNDENYLSPPFPVLYGLLKSTLELEQARIVARFPNTYVLLQSTGVRIVYGEPRKELLKYTPERVRTGVSEPFRSLKKLKNKEPQIHTRVTSQQQQFPNNPSKIEKDLCQDIVSRVNEYLFGDILRRLPCKAEVIRMRAELSGRVKVIEQKDINAVLISQIIATHKQGPKDPFYERFLETQMISCYLLR